MTQQDPRRAAPLFLERHRYRRRRLWDAVRLLPVLGLLLWMVPLMWPTQSGADGAGIKTSSALLYLFAVWVFLAVVARMLWWHTSRRDMPDD